MIGNTISHFKIIKKLGEGGMGVVYKAEDTKLKREVAIKFLPRQISVNLEERQRFEIEAQAAAALNHPNVAHIYSIEETDNEFFIVMEFIDGKELKDKIRDETIQMDEAVYLASCIAEGIHAAHKKGVVHRDIKSGNIMITQEGKVKIMDFGLAQMAGVTTLTKTGSTLGTTAYMSPEQASGEKLDAQTDIWSFGVVLYELLTGQLPFKGDYEQAIIYAIINDEPEPITSFREDVPEMMQMIIQKLLKKEKKERYHSIQDFMFDLQKVSAYLSRRSSKSAISGVKPLAGYKMDFDGTSKSKFQQTEAQRRNITSFYCSISIKSEGDAETDPEELSEVLPQCIDICEKVITRYSGYISAYTSDSISVCFGYPIAHEDEAKRSVYAAIGIREGIKQFSSKLLKEKNISAAVQISLHTGLVMIRDTGSSSIMNEIEILGETPGIAFQLQAFAEPNSIVISESTFKLVEGFIEYKELGSHNVKGINKFISLFQILNQSVKESRFFTGKNLEFTPLIGRKKEINLLTDSWENALEGMGQVISLEGEAGIGKSRLVQELKDHVAKLPGTWLVECSCSPYFQGTALYPIIELFEKTVLEFERNISPEDKLKKLEGFLVQYGLSLSETVPLFCSLLSIPFGSKYTPLVLTPEAQKNKILETLINLLLSRANIQPVLFIVDDLHWADPTTIELLKQAIQHVSIYKLLILFTYRPDFSEPWDKRSNVTKISLSKLPHKEIDNMVNRVANGKALPNSVIDQIKKKTDGVPLFIEELTKMVIESNLLIEKEDHYELKDELKPLTIPATLHDSLMARLDKMSSSKEIAQLGAAIGREFSYELIHAVSVFEEESLKRELNNLVNAEILYRKLLFGKESYIFKHALIQDVAYESILKSKRQILHNNIARVLEEQFSELTDTQPELFARHYTSAGIYDKAISFWQKAGLQELQRSANLEAISLLTKGLQVLEKLPEGPEKNQTELMLQATLGPAVIATKGFGASEVGAIFSRSAELCKIIGETPHLFPSVWGQWVYNLVQANLKAAVNLSAEMLNMGEHFQQSSMLIEGNWTMGNNLFWLGEYEKAAEFLEKALKLYDPQFHHPHAYIFGQDPAVAAHCYQSYTYWYLGYPDKALQKTDEVLKIANELKHPFSIGWALAFGTMVAGFRKDADLTLQRANATIEYCQKQAYPFWLSACLVWLGWAMAEKGNVDEGIKNMRQGLSIFDAIGSNVVQPMFMGILAEVLGENGNLEEAITIVDKAFEKARIQEEKTSEIDLYRIKGKLLLKQSQNNFESAEKLLEEGIAFADKLQAKSRKLQAAIDLSLMWKETGQKEKAFQLLSDVYNSFNEGHTTRDLLLAGQLLKDLS